MKRIGLAVAVMALAVAMTGMEVSAQEPGVCGTGALLAAMEREEARKAEEEAAVKAVMEKEHWNEDEWGFPYGTADAASAEAWEAAVKRMEAEERAIMAARRRIELRRRVREERGAAEKREKRGLVLRYVFGAGGEWGPGAVVEDSSGGGHDGRVGGDGLEVVRGIGKRGKAVRFDGKGDYIRVPRDGSLEGNEITVAAWLKVRDGAASCGEDGIGAVVFKRNTSFHDNEDYCLEIHPGRLLRTDLSSPYCVHAKVTTRAGLDPEVWHHVAVAVGGGVARIYVDGELAVEQVHVQPFDHNRTTDLFVGARDHAEHPMGRFGAFDLFELKIWDEALDGERVAALYREMAGCFGVAKRGAKGHGKRGPVLRYAFGKGGAWGPGSVVKDLSGQGHDGWVEGDGLEVVKGMGKGSKAARFDGKGDFIRVPRDKAFEGQEMSVAAWVRVREGASWENGSTIAFKRNAALSHNEAFHLEIFPDRTVRAVASGPNAAQCRVQSTVPMKDDEWHLVAMSHAPGDTQLYIDGELAGRGDQPQAVEHNPEADLLIGGRDHAQYPADLFANFDVAEVVVWNRALGEEEMAGMYREKAGRPGVGKTEAAGTALVESGLERKLSWRGIETTAKTCPQRTAGTRCGRGRRARGEWVVVDMSRGAGAERWPVEFLEAAPEGGFNREEYKTTKLVLRRIPAGTYRMGSPEGELGRYAGREDLHWVTLTEDFYMGVFEVTQKQWELATGRNPSEFRGDTRPVEGVSWNAARGASGDGVGEGSFLGVLRAKTGLAFDLPTEAQWEYACRAGTETALNSGKDLTGEGRCRNMDEVGRYPFNSGAAGACDGAGGGGYGHATVGSYRPNAWGLYDMHGNVEEWCLDWFAESLGTEAATDPQEAGEGMRVLRGGSWCYVGARCCRSAYRGRNPAGYCNGTIGLRVTCQAGGKKRGTRVFPEWKPETVESELVGELRALVAQGRRDRAASPEFLAALEGLAAKWEKDGGISADERGRRVATDRLPMTEDWRGEGWPLGWEAVRRDVWRFGDGEARQVESKANTRYVLFYEPGKAWKDYEVLVKFESDGWFSPPANSAAAVYVRYKGVDEAYCVVWDGCGSLHVSSCEAWGKGRLLACREMPVETIKDGLEWRVRVRGDEISVWHGGKQMLSVRDGTHREGTVGLESIHIPMRFGAVEVR